MKKSRRSRRSQRGYTAVEVLAAIMLFSIAAGWVISMEAISVKGSADSRNFDIATNIANEWAERLQRDSMLWTKPNSTDSSSNLATDTTYLKLIATCATAFCTPTLPTVAPTPPNVSAPDSAAFDRLGRDVVSGSGDHYFCAQIRLGWVANPANGPTGLMRADIRVFWNRLEYGAVTDCSSPAVDPNSAAAATHYHFVYLSTALRENAREQ